MVGAAVYQMAAEHNFAPSNAGVIFYMYIAIPAFGALLLWLQHHYSHPGARPVPSFATP